MTPTNEAERVARGLGPASRWALSHIGEQPIIYAALHGSVRVRLFRYGLLRCVMQEPAMFQITDFGLAVRQYLSKEADDGE